jgi:hypothetical protein
LVLRRQEEFQRHNEALSGLTQVSISRFPGNSGNGPGLCQPMSEWQNRPLDRVYPVVFIDAIVVKIRDGQVTNRPVYTAIGVTVDVERDGEESRWRGWGRGRGVFRWAIVTLSTGSGSSGPSGPHVGVPS